MHGNGGESWRPERSSPLVKQQTSRWLTIDYLVGMFVRSLIEFWLFLYVFFFSTPSILFIPTSIFPDQKQQ